MAVSPGFIPRILRISSRHVVHLHVGHAILPEITLLAAALRRFPYVAHFHIELAPSGPLGRALPLYKFLLLRPALRRASCVVALSDEVAADMGRRYGIPPERVLVMSNGVAPEFFSDRAGAAEPVHVDSERPLRLLFVGRLTRQKNVPRLFDAVALAKTPVELVIVGDGEDRAALEALARGAGLSNARFVGAKVGRELAEWHRWADVFVLSSDIEGGLPLVVLEAMAGGLPVIATDVAGISDTFGDAGLLAAPNPRSLAEAIDGIAADPELRMKVGGRNRERAEQYSWASRIVTLRELYRQVHPDYPGALDVEALRRLLEDGILESVV